MPRLSPIALCLAALALVAACQTTPGATPPGETGLTANAVVGDPIEVSALDPVPGGAPAPTKGAAPTEASTSAVTPAAPQPDAAAPETAEPEADPAAATPAPKAELDEPPAEVQAEPKSEQQLACERKRGTWAKVGRGELRACVYPTRDGGKSCRRESDCQDQCLARSGTCAPITPLFGCNEVFQENGARVTLCIE